MANFLDFEEITNALDLSGSSKIVGVKDDDSAEQQFSIDLLFEKFETNLDLSATSSVSFKNLSLTGLSLTGSEAVNSLSITSTWNTSGTVTAILLDITDTASNAASLLMDLKVGGTSIFSVGKSNLITLGSAFTIAGSTYINLNLNGEQKFGIGGSVNVSYQALMVSSGYLSLNNFSYLYSPSSAIVQFGLNHATTPTTQTIRAHDVTTGSGASLILEGGDGTNGKGFVTLNGAGRVEVTDFYAGGFVVNALLAHGIYSPPLNNFNAFSFVGHDSITLELNSSNTASAQWSIRFQYSLDNSSWLEGGVHTELGGGSSTSATISDLTPSTLYYFRWRSEVVGNSSVYSPWSSSQSNTTNPAP